MPYDVLIIGCGSIAGGYDADRPDHALPRTHAPAYRRDGGFRLLGCVDPDQERRQAFADRWGVAHAWPDLDTALSLSRFDVISICSPTDHHQTHLEAAIAALPRLIFCEKPVTVSLAQTQALVQAAGACGIGLAVNHTRRWAPDVVQLARELAAGDWGEVRSASAIYNKGVLNNGTHLFDLLIQLLGPVRVVAAGTPVADHLPSDPSISCLLETRDGRPVSVGIAHASDFALFELTLVTERGVISMEDGGARWRIRTSMDSPDFPGYRTLAPGQFRPGRYDEAMACAAGEIRSWLDGKATLSSSGETAAAAQAVSEAVRVRAGTN